MRALALGDAERGALLTAVPTRGTVTSAAPAQAHEAQPTLSGLPQLPGLPGSLPGLIGRERETAVALRPPVRTPAC